jgi:hypothetical protein
MAIKPIDNTQEMERARAEQRRSEKVEAKEQRAEAVAKEQNMEAQEAERQMEDKGKQVDVEA